MHQRAILILLALATPVCAQEGRTKSRLLFSFESDGEVTRLLKSSENSTLNATNDNGVTHGKNCARWVVKRGSPYGVLDLDALARIQAPKWRDRIAASIEALETQQQD